MNKRCKWIPVMAVVAIACLLASASGCKTKGGPKSIDPGYNLGADTGAEESTTGENLPELDSERLARLMFDKATGLQTVYFDFDSYALRPDALETLRQNADKIKQVPGVMIQIEGHCDERGTQEYNLALGEKRALAVRNHLMNLGVSGDRLITISYGEENPADPGHNEAAWAKNRRAEFNRAM